MLPRKRGREKKIEFGSVLEDTIYNLVRVHNVNNPRFKVELDQARRVVKRGLDLGNRETGIFRLRMFLSKKAGNYKSNYTEDDDLLWILTNKNKKQMLQGFHKGTFIVTLVIAIIVAGVIFNNYTKKKYNEDIFGKKIA